MTGYHTRWAPSQEQAEDPERIAIRDALAFGKALYDIRTVLGLTVAELAQRADMTDDEIECIEEEVSTLSGDCHRSGSKATRLDRRV